MDIVEEVERLLKELGERIGEELGLNEEGTCLFLLDENKLFMIDPDESTRTVIISVALGMLPAQDREEVLYDIATANYYWMRTAGATLGVDPETDMVLLCYAMQMPLENDSDFFYSVQKLANVADYWVHRLQNTGEPPAEDTPPDITMVKV